MNSNHSQINLDDLSNMEVDLYKFVISLSGSIEEINKKLEENKIFYRYKEIHRMYGQFHKKDLEALKRGLFLTWYSRVEPSFLTGINDLDLDVENKIIHTLNRRLQANVTDYELKWMLSYYAGWEWVFEDFNQYSAFQEKLRTLNVALPATIDRIEMENRGQMGMYWNSLRIFNDL